MLELINIALLMWWAIWRCRIGLKGWLGPAFPFAMALKAVAGIGLGLMYSIHYPGGDTTGYFHESAILADALRNFPEQKWHILFGSLDQFPGGLVLQYADQPRSFFFVRLLSLLYLITNGNYWISSVYLSWISFEGIFFLAGKIVHYYPEQRRVVMVSFMFLPSAVFWSSGILKESLAMPAVAVLCGLTLDQYERPLKTDFRWLYLGMPAAYVLWSLRYFYAAVLFPLMFALWIWRLMADNLMRPYARVLATLTIAGLFVMTIALLGRLHYNLKPGVLPGLIYENYVLMKSRSSEGAIVEFPGIGPAPMQVARQIPRSLAAGLFRPTVLDSQQFPALLTAMENTVLLILTALALAGLWRRGFRIDPRIVAIMLFIGILAAALPMASPNFGSLARYKVAYLPFLWLLAIAGAASTVRRWLKC